MCISGKVRKPHVAGVPKERKLHNLLGLDQELTSVIESIKAFCGKLWNKEIDFLSDKVLNPRMIL